MRVERSLSPSIEFERVRRELNLHPAESTAAATFEAAAVAARAVAEECLPLGLGVVMHLYPLCALRCVPLPWWSSANLRRRKLLRSIEHRSLILANAGSERAAGAHSPISVSRTHDGLVVSGVFEYMSLANVADIVLFSAPLAGSDNTVFCAADLHGSSVRVGASKFDGSMRLSDTCSVHFDNHRVPAERCIEIPNESSLQCMAQYQRSWFHLLLGEAYLARIEGLHRQRQIPRAPEFIASLNELAFLKKYSLCLLNEASSPGATESLSRVTAAIKLRISWLAQATAAAVRTTDPEAAHELAYISRQPTSDARILRSIGAAPQDSAGYGVTTLVGSLTL